MSTLIGHREHFGVEFSVHQISEKTTTGSLFFWVNGHQIGDASDRTVDLEGCFFWIANVACGTVSRYEPGLFETPVERAFEALALSVLADADPQGKFREIYANTFSRFHITHCGMSSFDAFTVLLVENLTGGQRLIWRDWREIAAPPRDAIFEHSAVTTTLAESCTAWRELKASVVREAEVPRTGLTGGSKAKHVSN